MSHWNIHDLQKHEQESSLDSTAFIISFFWPSLILCVEMFLTSSACQRSRGPAEDQPDATPHHPHGGHPHAYPKTAHPRRHRPGGVRDAPR